MARIRNFDRYYYDPPEEYCVTELGKTQPKAAKGYTCSHCGQPIIKGAKHNKLAYRDDDGDGKIHSDRFHLVCPWEQQDF